MNETQFLDASHGTRIAYHRVEGRTPGVVFLGGFMSDMQGQKALALQAWCESEGRAFVRFDYQAHGQSSGDIIDGCISLWASDALAVIDQLTSGPQVLVGSSMGGWIAMLVARARTERIAGLVGVAAAPDFTVRRWEALSAADRATMRTMGCISVPTAYGPDPYLLTMHLFEDGDRNLVLERPYEHAFPVRLIHGTEDPDVPVEIADRIAGCLTGEDVAVIRVTGGDHRLSEPADLVRLTETVASLADRP